MRHYLVRFLCGRMWVVFTLLIAIDIKAQDLDVVPSIYAAANATNDSSNQGLKQVLGESYELGLSVFFDRLGVDVFEKRVKYSKEVENQDKVKTSDFRFTDNMYGAGLRILGNGYSFKVGRANHDMTGKEHVTGATTNNLPNGKEIGNYIGAGLFLGFKGNIDLQIDYTYYDLPSFKYKIDEVSVGIRFDFGSTRTGGSSSKH